MMDYQEYKQAYLTRQGLNAGDLNLYSKFPQLNTPSMVKGHKDGEVYRCHLSDDFIREFGLEFGRDEVSYTVGVRASLNALAMSLADRKWLIPSDTYPFYQKTLEGVLFSEYETFDSPPIHLPLGGVSVLLVTDPLKPSSEEIHGSWLSDIGQWLKDMDENLLIVDAVYRDIRELNPGLKALYLEHPKQVLLLTSFSKIAASPGIAGFSITKNVEVLKTLRSLEKPEREVLQKAYHLINSPEGRNRRAEVRAFMDEQQQKALALGLISEPLIAGAYLFRGSMLFENYSKTQIFTIPATVYNSSSPHPVISVLGL